MRELSTTDNIIVELSGKLRKPATLIWFVFGFEALLGHPALRLTWEASSYRELSSSMTHCEVMSFPLCERQQFYGYVPLFTFVEPETTIRQLCIRKLFNQSN